MNINNDLRKLFLLVIVWLIKVGYANLVKQNGIQLYVNISF